MIRATSGRACLLIRYCYGAELAQCRVIIVLQPHDMARHAVPAGSNFAEFDPLEFVSEHRARDQSDPESLRYQGHQIFAADIVDLNRRGNAELRGSAEDVGSISGPGPSAPTMKVSVAKSSQSKAVALVKRCVSSR